MVCIVRHGHQLPFELFSASIKQAGKGLPDGSFMADIELSELV